MKRIASLFAVVCLCLSMLMACNSSGANTSTESGTSSSPTESGTSNSQPAESSAPSDTSFDPFGKYDPPIELRAVNMRISGSVTFPEGDSVENNVWTRYYEEALGIKVDVMFGTDDSERLTRQIASGDIPDLFAINGTLPLFQQLLDEGVLEDMTDYYEQYATPLVKRLMTIDGGASLNAGARDGRIYSLPWWSDTLDSANVLWVREDWRTKLGLPEPKSMDDVRAISTAFATRDPDGNGANDTFGLYISGDGLWEDGYRDALYGFFAGYGAYPFIWLNDGSGNIVYGKTQGDTIKPALKALQEMYAAKELPPEFALKKGEQFVEETNQEKYGIIYGAYYYPLWPFLDAKKNNPDLEWKPYLLPSETGTPAKAGINAMNINYHFVVRKGYEHPEAVVKMLNLATEKLFGETAEPDTYNSGPATGAMYWRYTLISQSYPRQEPLKNINILAAIESGDDSKLTPLEKVNYDQIMAYRANNDPEFNGWAAERTYGEGSAAGLQNEMEQNGLILRNEFYGPKTPTMEELLFNLNVKFNEVMTKIIMGDSVDTYDEYVSDWYANGGRQITDEVNAWHATRGK